MKRNFFTLNQIGEEYALYAEDIRRGTPTAVFGVSDSHKYMLAGLIESPVLYVTTDGVSARKIAEKHSRRFGQDHRSFGGERRGAFLSKSPLQRRALSQIKRYLRPANGGGGRRCGNRRSFATFS